MNYISIWVSFLYLLTTVTPSNVHIMAFFVLAQLRSSTKPQLLPIYWFFFCFLFIFNCLWQLRLPLLGQSTSKSLLGLVTQNVGGRESTLPNKTKQGLRRRQQYGGLLFYWIWDENGQLPLMAYCWSLTKTSTSFHLRVWLGIHFCSSVGKIIIQRGFIQIIRGDELIFLVSLT